MKITHDFHIHSHFSSCANESAAVGHYVNKARELGLTKIGFADHMWDAAISGANGWYKNQNFEHILQLKKEIAAVDTDGLKIYFGCETEYDLTNKGVAISQEVAKQLDFLLVPNSHTHITMPKDYYTPYQKHADFMVEAFYDIVNSNVSKFITAIAHPFFAVGCPYDNRALFELISDARFEDMFKIAKEKDIALEINLGCYKNRKLAEIYADPSLRMYRIAKDVGCKFTIGSDSHSSSGHDYFELLYVLIGLLDLNNAHFADIVSE